MTEIPPGFIPIHPAVRLEAECPFVGRKLEAVDWAVPGMWTMARLHDPATDKSYWTDLPFGVGLIAPCFIDIARGDVQRPAGARWYVDVTQHAWKTRFERPTKVSVEIRKKARNGCLINCLYPHWGDAVSLLLRLNQVRRSGLDLIVIITPNLQWLVPDDVAEVWIVEGGHGSTNQWNESLAAEIRKLVAATERCFVPSIFQPAQLSGSELTEFTRIPVFNCQQWSESLGSKPVVTFVWRPDRCWAPDPPSSGVMHWRIARSRYLRQFRDWVSRRRNRAALATQTSQVISLAEELRAHLPGMDFGVIGPGTSSELPAFVKDLRSDAMSVETEQAWCRRAAESHIIIGV